MMINDGIDVVVGGGGGDDDDDVGASIPPA
jgi:hypothetical protein